ncbi:hypothetical protein BGX31_003386 [Mortierella sp. GBA43]|nr:hypothetical protein BGX31_003386 [Mortierella sp. GBA43]
MEAANWKMLQITPTDFTIGDEMAVTDPDTGFIYIPRATSIDQAQGFTMRLDIASNKYDRMAIHEDVLATNDYAAAWSTSLRKLVLVGGWRLGSYRFERKAEKLYVFTYTDKFGWRDETAQMKGQIPQPRYSACLAPASGGTKMVLFGGAGMSPGFFGDTKLTFPEIYVLDMQTMNWTKGPDVPAKDKRINAACAVSNDQFIAWGGASEADNIINDTLVQDSTLVFNLKTSKWTSTFIAGPRSTTTRRNVGASPTAPPDLGSNQDNHSTGGLSRITVITIAVLGVAGMALGTSGLVLYRARRKRLPEVLHDDKPRESPVSAARVAFLTNDPGRGPQTFPRNPQGYIPPQENRQALLVSQSPQNPHTPVPDQSPENRGNGHHTLTNSQVTNILPQTSTAWRIGCPQEGHPSPEQSSQHVHPISHSTFLKDYKLPDQ